MRSGTGDANCGVTMRIALPARVLVLVLAATFAATVPAGAFHTVFHYEVDRFEADGNHFGPSGGPLDFVDEFDGGGLSPWNVLFGTAFESGGTLHLTNPGTHFYNGFDLDLSNVYNGVFVFNGMGSFTATSRWAPRPIAPNTVIHMTLFTFTGNLAYPWEAFGIDLSNWNSQLAFEQHYQRFENGVPQPVTGNSMPIDASDITGPIHFRVAVDDTTDQAVVSVSLDGGTTFQSPFPPLAVFQGTTTGMFILGADPAAGTEQPTTTTVSTSSTTSTTLPTLCQGGFTISEPRLVLKVGAPSPGDEGLAFRGRIATGVAYDAIAEGAQLRVEEMAVQQPTQTLLDLVAPAAIPAGNPGVGCGPQDGWLGSAAAASYKNGSNALPAGCGPGSANGLKRLKFKDRRRRSGAIVFQMSTKKSSLPFLASLAGGVDTMRATIVLGASPGDAAAGRCATITLPCRTSKKKISCP
jgi:hypothetical protein